LVLEGDVTRPQTASAPLLELSGVTKRFPGVVANDKVSFSLFGGEIHALLGENGAGKTTLVSMLYGLLTPDEGEIRLAGQPLRLKSPSDALRVGISLVPQHPLLVDNHTVLENIALSSGGGFALELRGLRKTLLEVSSAYGLQISPDAKVWQLSEGEKQRIELLKALVRGSKILILDEPTSALTPQESEGLFEVLNTLKLEGKAMVLISHKLDEVLLHSDRITVLRKGQVVGSLPAQGLSKPDLSRMMVGRDVSFERQKEVRAPGKIVLALEKVWTKSNRGLDAMRDVSLEVREGEILGVAGVAGNGQHELAEVIAGLRKLERGTLRILEQSAAHLSPAQISGLGVAHIPEDRRAEGVVSEMSVADNLFLRRSRTAGSWIDRKKLLEFAGERIRTFEVSTPGPHTPAGKLSGGNIQKLILARELDGNPKLILAVHPTHGLDVGATEQVHRILLEARMKGAAVLLISEDLDEVLTLSDRVAVLFSGEIQGVLEGAQATRERVGSRMAGVRESAAQKAEGGKRKAESISPSEGPAHV